MTEILTTLNSIVWSASWSQEFPCWLDNFLQQEFHQLDGQVPPQDDVDSVSIDFQLVVTLSLASESP